ncbi:MAG TPA: choice-of-anchor D domain-containing protein, partial [Terriglobales bacterium]|nr:choice-of-anchor D domain-containing protein [Terriglobales bacterium]
QCQTIGPNQSCQLQVGFNPTAAQPTQPQTFSGTLQISIPDANGAPSIVKSITLSGTGTIAPPPQPGSPLSVSPGSDDFGNIPIGTSATANFTVFNSSASPVNFTFSELSSPFSITANRCANPNGSNTVAANGSCTFIIEFQPTQATTFQTQGLTLFDETSGNELAFIFFTGGGIAGVPVTYDNNGNQTNSHIVSGQAVSPTGFGNGVQVTLLNAAAFKSASSYVCTATVVGSSSGLTVSVRLDNGSQFTIFSNVTSGAINYICIGN